MNFHFALNFVEEYIPRHVKIYIVWRIWRWYKYNPMRKIFYLFAAVNFPEMVIEFGESEFNEGWLCMYNVGFIESFPFIIQADVICCWLLSKPVTRYTVTMSSK